LAVSVFQEFFDWLFNGDFKSPIPKEVLKSSSPISQQYAISIFLAHSKLNNYLDENFNNINLWYLDKSELFIFLKKCVKDFKVNRRSLVYVSWNRTSKIYDELRKRIPNLKANEITYLVEIIDKSEIKDEIYSALSLDKVEKPKMTKKSKKNDENKTITIEEFLSSNFKFIEVNAESCKNE
jgi:hypothetical protein